MVLFYQILYPNEVFMELSFIKIQELLRERADIHSRLALLPYDGAPEIKEKNGRKYLYVRRRVASKNTSTYVDVYSDGLYQLLLRNNREARELRKALRHVDKALAELGYAKAELPPDVVLNLEFARANLKQNIYDQAVLEGVATSFPQTEEIIDNGIVNGMTASDVQKILNLKHAWEFILDEDVLQAKTDYALLTHIAKLVNEGFFSDGGRIRRIPVTIGGCSYVPPIPFEADVVANIEQILSAGDDLPTTAIRLCLYAMRTQVFVDGNKRASVIFANHFLISHGAGMLIIPDKLVPEFKKQLVGFYESGKEAEILTFMMDSCMKSYE